MIWQALTSVQPWDVLHLYIFCRHIFFAEYQTWSQTKKNWAVKHIKKRYQRKMDKE